MESSEVITVLTKSWTKTWIFFFFSFFLFFSNINQLIEWRGNGEQKRL